MPRPPSYDRENAIARAVSLFWAKGYHGSSMKQIEQALSMRPGSIYAAFGNKDGLYAEALSRYATTGSQELVEHMTHYEVIVEGLKDYLRMIANGCADRDAQPSKACLIVKTLLESSNTHSGISSQARAILSSIESALSRFLEEAQRRGELRQDVDCRRLARLVQSQIMGLRSIAERGLSSKELEQLAEDMAAILDAYTLA